MNLLPQTQIFNRQSFEITQFRCCVVWFGHLRSVALCCVCHYIRIQCWCFTQTSTFCGDFLVGCELHETIKFLWRTHSAFENLTIFLCHREGHGRHSDCCYCTNKQFIVYRPPSNMHWCQINEWIIYKENSFDGENCDECINRVMMAQIKCLICNYMSIPLCSYVLFVVVACVEHNGGGCCCYNR